MFLENSYKCCQLVEIAITKQGSLVTSKLLDITLKKSVHVRFHLSLFMSTIALKWLQHQYWWERTEYNLSAYTNGFDAYDEFWKHYWKFLLAALKIFAIWLQCALCDVRIRRELCDGTKSQSFYKLLNPTNLVFLNSLLYWHWLAEY